MYSYIFNATNLFMLAMFCLFSYFFWSPYIKGKKTEGVIEGFSHPKKGEKKDVTFVCKIMYKDEKGRRQYCYSKRVFDTQGEAMQYYHKGDKVKVCVYTEAREDNYETAMIMSDGKDIRTTLFYTFAAFVSCSALALGFQMYQFYFGS